MTTRHTKGRLGSDLFLALASLVIAFVIWTISKRGDTAWETFQVPVKLKNVPENIQVKLDREISRVTLPVPNSIRGQIDSGTFLLELDFNKEKELEEPRRWCGIEDFRPARKIELEARHLRVAPNAPIQNPNLRQLLENKLSAASISGGDVVVRGKLITRAARPVFRVTGKPVVGCRVLEPIQRMDQRTILLTAASGVFSKRYPNQDEPVPVDTEEIDLNKKDSSFKISVALRLPPDIELVTPEDQRVEANVRMEVTTAFDTVSVALPHTPPNLLIECIPRTARVTLRGPDEWLYNNLKASDINLRATQFKMPDPGKETQARLLAFFNDDVPKSAIETVTILSVKPDTVKILCRERPAGGMMRSPLPQELISTGSLPTLPPPTPKTPPKPTQKPVATPTPPVTTSSLSSGITPPTPPTTGLTTATTPQEANPANPAPNPAAPNSPAAPNPTAPAAPDTFPAPETMDTPGRSKTNP